MNKCPKCGTTSRIREKDNFCHNCGCNLHLGKIKEVVKEVLQGSEVETVEERYITGERRIITLLDGKEINNVVIGADGKESIKLEDVVDSTIESICERIQKNDMLPEEYADTLKALAALVEARARLNQR